MRALIHFVARQDSSLYIGNAIALELRALGRAWRLLPASACFVRVFREVVQEVEKRL